MHLTSCKNYFTSSYPHHYEEVVVIVVEVVAARPACSLWLRLHHHLQGARLPHGPLKDTFVYKRIPLLSGCIVNKQQACFLVDTSQGKVFIKGTVPPCEEHICSLHGELMRQPAKVLFLCAEMIYGTH